MKVEPKVSIEQCQQAEAPDLKSLPVVVGILVQKMVDEPYVTGRMAIRDRLATYVSKESQGYMSLSTARTLNQILVQLGVEPVKVPEVATCGSFADMVREHLSVNVTWNGTRYVPMSPGEQESRAAVVDQVMAEVKNAVGDPNSLTPQELTEAREILLRALRALGPSPVV